MNAEVRFYAIGEAVANVNIATSESWRDKANRVKCKSENRSGTSVALMDSRATSDWVQIAGDFIKKGSKSLRRRNRWRSHKNGKKNGIKITTTYREIVAKTKMQLLDGRGDGRKYAAQQGDRFTDRYGQGGVEWQ